MSLWQSPDAQRMWRLAARYTSLGIEMAADVALPVLFCRWLDRQLGTSPYLLWFGVVVGVGAVGKSVWRVVRAAKRDQLL